jgi:hypothetical protein
MTQWRRLGWGVVGALLIGGVLVVTPAVAQAAPAVNSTRLHADFNGDGYDDVAIGVPDEDVDGATDAGLVQIIYGGPDGLDTSQILVQDPANDVDGFDHPETGDHFGAALAVGDIDRNGVTDLVVGAPEEDIGAAADTGAITVYFGRSGQQLSQPAGRFLSQDLVSNEGFPNEPGDRFGAALAVGDFDVASGALLEIAVGVPGEDLTVADAGQVQVIGFVNNGGFLAADPTRTFFLDQDEFGVPGVATAGDQFGAALAVGDFGTDPQDDLAVGVPHDEVGTVDDAGSVQIFYGTTIRLGTNSNDRLFHEGAGGLPETPEPGDRFGSSLAVGDFNRDAPDATGQLPDDLATGAPGENGGEGRVQVLYRSANVLSASGNQMWGLDTTFPGTANQGDGFGTALAASDFNADGFDDLAFGVPGDDSNGNTDAGAVNVVYGQGSIGLDLPHAQFITQDSLGFSAGATVRARFGAALTAGRYDGDRKADLVVGVPGKILVAGGTIRVDAGEVNLIFGKHPLFAFGGLNTNRGQVLRQGSGHVGDTVEAGDRFGTAVR